jgi:hypothetical protein
MACVLSYGGFAHPVGKEAPPVSVFVTPADAGVQMRDAMVLHDIGGRGSRLSPG